MSWCNDPWKHEQEGRDAARYRDDYSWEHRERMQNGRYDSYSCDAAYARGYEREQRYQEELREEERQREAYEERRAWERAEKARQHEEAMYSQYPEPPYDPGPPYPEHEDPTLGEDDPLPEKVSVEPHSPGWAKVRKAKNRLQRIPITKRNW